ncbi:MAG: GNAT family N-acetyltransferase [Chitinophagaceae bacterium]
MIYATTTSSENDLQQILDLQIKNLKNNISSEEKSEQGFLTMPFTMKMLEIFHAIAPSVIIKDDEKVVAYAIVLMQECRRAYPDLEPLFATFSRLSWKNKPLYDYNFYVMGQICIDKDYRSKGLFEMLYHKHRDTYQSQFDFIITDISTSNLRSLKAHHRVGFITIERFKDVLDEWDVVVWDWR